MKVLEVKLNNNSIKYYIIEARALKLKDNQPIEYNNFGKNLNLSNCKTMKIKEMKILDNNDNKIIALIDNEEFLLEKTNLCEYVLKE